MNRAKSGDALRQSIFKLIDSHGQSLLTELKQMGASAAEAEVVYYRTFLAALDKLQRPVAGRFIRRDGQAALLEIGRAVLEDLQKTQGQLPTDDKEAVATVQTTEREGEDAGFDEGLLRPRMEKLLRAALVEAQATRRHRGPVWTTYAMGTMVVFGICAVIYGNYHTSTVKVAAAAENQVSKLDASFPPPLSNLPVDVKGQLLTQAGQSISRIATTASAVYYPALNSPAAGKAPTFSLYRSPFSNGKFVTGGTPYVSYGLQLPRSTSHSESFKVSKWDFQIMKSWGVLTVKWQDTKTNQVTTQVYLMGIESKSHALVLTLKPEAGGASSYTVATGLNRIVVQGILPSNGGSETGLPVTIYQLQGSDVNHALSKWKVLSSVPGQLVKPTVTEMGIVSQGYAGQSTSPDTLNATWYLLNWQGGVTEEIGPPLDQRPHWAVQGGSGKDGESVWWVETTPSGSKSHAQQLQVLMGSLSDASVTNQPPALSLNGSVTEFHVSDGYLEWIQDTQKVPQLVVAKVQ